jgi:hypothetical protein
MERLFVVHQTRFKMLQPTKTVCMLVGESHMCTFCGARAVQLSNCHLSTEQPPHRPHGTPTPHLYGTTMEDTFTTR